MYQMWSKWLLWAMIKCTLCAGLARAEDAEPLPRSWAYRHTPGPGFSRVQTPSLQLPLADPVAFLERHEAVLGHNARNVINIAPEVGCHQTLHT